MSAVFVFAKKLQFSLYIIIDILPVAESLTLTYFSLSAVFNKNKIANV